MSLLVTVVVYLTICGLAAALVGPKFGLGLLVAWLICVVLAVAI
jgi:hypothetical protein